MTNAQQKALAAERYPELFPADARKALRRDLKVEREQDERYRQWNLRMDSVMDGLHTLGADIAKSNTERLRDAPARIERDLDMAGIAQTPRRQPRRKLNPLMAALVGGLLIGYPKGDER